MPSRYAVAAPEGSDAGVKDACHWEALVRRQVTLSTPPHLRLTWNGAAGETVMAKLAPQSAQLQSVADRRSPRRNDG